MRISDQVGAGAEREREVNDVINSNTDRDWLHWIPSLCGPIVASVVCRMLIGYRHG